MIKAIEKWKPIPGWEEYLVSDMGNVWSIRRNKLLSVWKGENKYPRVSLSSNTIEKTLTVHKLVALAFLENPEGKATVNHKDGNKHNNNVTNLEWATYRENMRHAVASGLCEPPILPCGEQHPSAKLTNIDIAMIRVLLNNGFTQDQVAKRFNVHNTHISSIALGKTRFALTGEELEVKL